MLITSAPFINLSINASLIGHALLRSLITKVDQTLTDDNDIADAFNNYFASVALPSNGNTIQIFLSLTFLLLIILTLVKVICLLQSGSLRST